MSAKQKSSGVSPVLIILVVVLIAGGFLFVKDKGVRAKHDAAFERLEDIQVKEEDVDKKKPPTPADVQKQVGQAPEGEMKAVGDDFVETYAFKGILRRFTIEVTYDKDKLMKGFATK